MRVKWPTVCLGCGTTELLGEIEDHWTSDDSCGAGCVGCCLALGGKSYGSPINQVWSTLDCDHFLCPTCLQYARNKVRPKYLLTSMLLIIGISLTFFTFFISVIAVNGLVVSGLTAMAPVFTVSIITAVLYVPHRWYNMLNSQPNRLFIAIHKRRNELKFRIKSPEYFEVFKQVNVNLDAELIEDFRPRFSYFWTLDEGLCIFGFALPLTLMYIIPFLLRFLGF
ncbi:MAG: hypothetical protein ACTSWA_06325 [Candidatus Thorarchaeota archaeon]